MAKMKHNKKKRRIQMGKFNIMDYIDEYDGPESNGKADVFKMKKKVKPSDTWSTSHQQKGKKSKGKRGTNPYKNSKNQIVEF